MIKRSQPCFCPKRGANVFYNNLLKLCSIIPLILLCITYIVDDVSASTEIIPLTTENWLGYSQYGTVDVAAVADGIQINGYGIRQGSLEKTKNTYDFTDSETYIKWKAHGAGYMKAVVGIGNVASEVITNGNTTTDHSVGGSTLIVDDTWYYTRIKINSDNVTYKSITATNSYDNSGGTVFTSLTGSITTPSSFQNGVIYASLAENDGGTASYMVIGEAKIIKAVLCATITKAGGDTPETFDFNMGANSGRFSLEYDTYFIEDEIVVMYEGKTLYDTGCVGKQDSVLISFSGSSPLITVFVNPNCSGGTSGTAWQFVVSCPVGSITAKVFGNGLVSSSDYNISCRKDRGVCSYVYKTASNVTLTANADLDYTFTGWDGACQGKTITCTLLTSDDKSVAANFTSNELLTKLSVLKTGRSSGTVTVSAGKMFWNKNQGTAYYELNDPVTLTATPETNAGFGGWGGDCTGSSTTCNLTMSTGKSVYAIFDPYPMLKVIKAGDGEGTVTGSTGSITWSGKTGTAYYNLGTSVVLTATPTSGSVFSGWSDDCNGSNSTCTVGMSANRSVTATFTSNSQSRYKLTVTKNGNGVGTITPSTGTLIWYDNVGTITYAKDTQVILTAAADTGSTFATWGGACSGSSTTCSLTMSEAKDVSAEFNQSIVNPPPKKATVNDFDGDGYSDVLWYNNSTGDIYIWLMQGTAIVGGSYVAKGVTSDWVIKGVGDFNGDGKSDILWQNVNNNAVYIWYMDGITISTGGYVVNGLPNEWVFKVIGDFDGDGKSDIMWQNTTNGDVYVWLMDGTTIKSGGYAAKSISAEWAIRAAADLNGDKKSDIIWQNTANGDIYIWLMDGTSISGGGYASLNVPNGWQVNDWQIMAANDFNGDSKGDILWQNTSTGDLYAFLMDGVTSAGGGYVGHGIPSSWQIKKTGFYKGDGKADILWQNTTNGDVYIYLMDGLYIFGGGYAANGLTNSWQVK
ncbi:MAG: VCBS repeat-containing protein [Nitrospirae bacterium]|nr:VCBS repeat-containing protein [Nitrospirota bacterium]